MKWANDHKAFKPSVFILSKQTQNLVRVQTMRAKLCETTVYEYLDNVCTTCSGRGHIMASELSAKHACTSCDTTGLRRHSSAERCRALGISIDAYPKWELKFTQVHHKISDADSRAWRDVATQLGRIGGPQVAKKVLAISRRPFILRAISSEPAPNNNALPEQLVSSAAGV